MIARPCQIELPDVREGSFWCVLVKVRIPIVILVMTFRFFTVTWILSIRRSCDIVPVHILLTRTARPGLLAGHRASMAADALVYIDQHPVLRTVSILGIRLTVVFLPKFFRHSLSFRVESLSFLHLADLVEMTRHWAPEIRLEIDFMDRVHGVVSEAIPVTLSDLLTLPSEIDYNSTWRNGLCEF